MQLCGIELCCTSFTGASVQPDVLEKVCAIARREEKPNQPVMLAALLLCKPTTSKVHCQLQSLKHSAVLVLTCVCICTGACYIACAQMQTGAFLLHVCTCTRAHRHMQIYCARVHMPFSNCATQCLYAGGLGFPVLQSEQAEGV